MEEQDFYSVEEAARVLQLTPGRVRQMLRAGALVRVVAAQQGRIEESASKIEALEDRLRELEKAPSKKKSDQEEVA